MLDWKLFFDQYNIEYIEHGRNVSKGNISTHCPFCGLADSSMHMSVSLRGYGWSCWRDAEHRGKSKAKLIQALLNCSWAEANKIAGEEGPAPTDESFTSQVQRLLGQVTVTKSDTELKLPNECRPLIATGGIFRNPIIEYIKSRGYSEHDVLYLSKRYEINYSIRGAWSRRVIWPIRNEHGELVNYTARTIGTSTVRYKTLSGDKAKARMSDCLFDLHTLFKVKGSVLVVCEGPFDAMRIGWIGEPLGIFATCVFTQNISDTQAALLMRLADRFDKLVILFDRAAELHSFKAQMLLGGNCERAVMPEGIKDPGELSASQALALCRQLL